MEKLGLGKQKLEDTNSHKVKVLNTLSGKLECSESKSDINISLRNANMTYFLLLSFFS